jgi:hypothetical protein
MDAIDQMKMVAMEVRQIFAETFPKMNVQRQKIVNG